MMKTVRIVLNESNGSAANKMSHLLSATHATQEWWRGKDGEGTRNQECGEVDLGSNYN